MKLSKLAVSRPITALMLLAFLMLLGWVGFSRMSIDLFPDLQTPYLVISTRVENFNPDEIEARITMPLEKVLSTLPNLSSLHAESRLGISIITLKFKWGSQMKQNKEKTQEKLEAVKNFLPKDAPEPAIFPLDPSSMPIMQWVISQKEDNPSRTKKIAEQKIIPHLQNLDGVAAVTLEGIKERQFQIHLHPKQLAAHQLNFEQIRELLISEHINLPGGTRMQNEQSQPIQITGNFETLYDLSQLNIPTKDGMIPLQKLATLQEVTLPKGYIAYINGKPCIGLSIFKANGKNTVQLAKQVQNEIHIIEKYLPSDIKLENVFNQSDFINQAISSIYSAIFLGGLAAAGVLYLFLRNMRSTLTIFLTIPVTVLVCFFFMYVFKQNFNLLTLGALSLGIGMMIDNAIVIVESIEQQRTITTSNKQAALLGTKQVFFPMLASTFTSVIVFVPFLLVDGLIAQIFFPLAIVVILSQLTSLFVAFLLIPLMIGNKKNITRLFSASSKNRLATGYQKILPAFIKYPKTIILSCLFLVIGAIWLTKFLEVEFLPHQDQSFVIIHMKMPVGTSLQATEHTTLPLLKKFKETSGVRTVYSTIGGTPSAAIQSHTHPNEANFYCLLHKKKNRTETDLQIAQNIEATLKKTPNIQYTISVSDPGFFDNQMKIRICSPNRNEIVAVAEEIEKTLQSNKNITRIQTKGMEKTTVCTAKVQEGKAHLFGINRVSIAQQLYAMTNGQEVMKLMEQKEDIPILLFLQMQPNQQVTENLEQLTLYSPTHGAIPFPSVAKLYDTQQVSEQSRYNQQAQSLISYEVQPKKQKIALKQVQSLLADINHRNPNVHIQLDGQASQIKESFHQMKLICGFALLFIYMILAAQFDSFIVPFILIFSIPVIGIGIVLSLLIFDQPLSASSFVGILLLIGVVINNAILLLDSIMQHVKSGLNVPQAILAGAPSRIRPIFMTAATTILGIIPLLIGSGEGMEFQKPMSIVIVFGLISSTFITLVLIPAVLVQSEKWITRSWRKNNLSP